MKYLILLLMIANSIGPKNADNSNNQIEYDKILDGLDLSYVEFVQSTEDRFKNSVLSFFKKDYSEYQKDSSIYYKALSDFYSSDIEILNYLMHLKEINDKCFWLYGNCSMHHPFSSKADVCYSQFISKQKNASLILAFNHLFNKDNRKFILIKNEISDCKIESYYLIFEEYLHTKSKISLENLKTIYKDLFDVEERN